MDVLLFLVGILGIIAGLVLFIMALVKRSNWWLLRSGAIFGVGLLLLIIGIAFGIAKGPSEEVTSATPTGEESPVIDLGKTRSNPVPLGSSLRYGDTELIVLDLVRVQASEGKVHAVVTVRLRNVESQNESETYRESDFSIVGSKGILCTETEHYVYGVDELNLLFDTWEKQLSGIVVFGGTTISGNIVFDVDQDDSNLVLIWSASWNTSRYFSLE